MLTTKNSNDAAKLQNFSEEHLYYEIRMLYEVTLRLITQQMNDVLKFALIESFVIHAANLLDFLFNNQQKPEDAIANHYVYDQNKWRIKYSSFRKILQFVISRRNKELAHLSYERLNVDADQKKWCYAAISRDISFLVDSFIDLANNNFLHANVIALKGQFTNHPICKCIPDFQNLPLKENMDSGDTYSIN